MDEAGHQLHIKVDWTIRRRAGVGSNTADSRPCSHKYSNLRPTGIGPHESQQRKSAPQATRSGAGSGPLTGLSRVCGDESCTKEQS